MKINVARKAYNPSLEQLQARARTQIRPITAWARINLFDLYGTPVWLW